MKELKEGEALPLALFIGLIRKDKPYSWIRFLDWIKELVEEA